MQLGHRKPDGDSEPGTPFKPAYLKGALTVDEAVIDDIGKAVPGAFHRADTGNMGNFVPLQA